MTARTEKEKNEEIDAILSGQMNGTFFRVGEITGVPWRVLRMVSIHDVLSLLRDSRYEVVANEIVRRLRAGEDHGDPAQLRELGAKVIEQLLEQKATMARLLKKRGTRP